MMNKIKTWFLKIFKKKTLLLPLETNIKEHKEKEDPLRKEFKDALRTVVSEEEKVLMKKFENGEITFVDITEEVLEKISRGYSLEITKNINIIESNRENLKRISAPQN